MNDTIEQQEQTETQNLDIKPILEVLIFAADEPLTFKVVQSVVADIKKQDVDKTIKELNEEYEKNARTFRIKELAGGWQMVTVEEYAFWLRKVYALRKKGKLSKPALETLSIVAYKQPATKIEVENIRGVNSDGVMRMLLEKDFVKILGRKDVPGRPIIYGTTDKFLKYFGLSDLNNLPDVNEFVEGGDNGQEQNSRETE